ncbi:ribonuclease Z [Rhizobium sp. P32RR-XVIII]|uniref:ribonuclease Z n=1 Tax=Rhizobium sp. P32RR-XVIII TaxID=2726738 RepID=UPI00145665EE|nr:MBL fold metallo-hydrolase [Rhizobium sp. P32RR-XVIII]NLS04080.1 ribonuclease Z [Rhizobium sp. P32RR-XVIII]
MVLMVQPRLVNGAFGDPSLFLDFSFGRRAILFDLGDIRNLSARETLRVRHVFISHMHVDHFIGFDELLRLFLHKEVNLHLYGPPGLIRAVQAKLGGYTWNLLNQTSPDFRLHAWEWSPEGFCSRQSFHARCRFEAGKARQEALRSKVLLEEPDFYVEVEMLDHGIPSLAFAFQERLKVNVHKSKLDALGLPVGPWLSTAKKLVRSGAPGDTVVVVDPEREVALADLIVAQALVSDPGERVAYATDFAYTDENVERVVRLAQRSDYFFIESTFLDADAAIASSRRHLTAHQAGEIAARTFAKRAVPMHFSPRYLGREEELLAEFEQGRNSRRSRQN